MVSLLSARGLLLNDPLPGIVSGSVLLCYNGKGWRAKTGISRWGYTCTNQKLVFRCSITLDSAHML